MLNIKTDKMRELLKIQRRRHRREQVKKFFVQIYRRLDPIVCSKCGTPKCVGTKHPYCPKCEEPI